MSNDFYCEECDVFDELDCICIYDPDPQTYKELKEEGERRRRRSERRKDNEFKSKIKSIGFRRVPGGGRDS